MQQEWLPRLRLWAPLAAVPCGGAAERSQADGLWVLCPLEVWPWARHQPCFAGVSHRRTVMVLSGVHEATRELRLRRVPPSKA